MARWQRLDRWHRRVFYSVRGRATVVTLAVSALILAVVFVLVFVLARDAIRNRTEETAQRTAERVADDLVDGVPPGRALRPRPGEAPLIQIVDRQGDVVAANAAAAGRPPFAADDIRSGELLIDGRVCGPPGQRCARVFGLRLRDSPWGRRVTVVAAEPIPELVRFWLVPVAVIVALAALLALIGWWTWHTIGRTFVPIDRIRAELADITARGLARRVPVPRTRDEIQHLAETANRTLERLEEAMSRERRFVSDASHDLRNPITGLHTRLEFALGETDPDELRDAVRAALHDTERLNNIVIDLLELSRLDSRAPVPLERIDLAELAHREVARRPSGIPTAARLEPGAVIEASPVRISRVIGNLLGNAERHAASRIEVTVARDGNEAVLEVADDGAGIPPEEHERVFERFARLGESRRRDPQGTGLGLPIAREIAEIYGGTLRLREPRPDELGGAHFEMRLPLAPPDRTP